MKKKDIDKNILEFNKPFILKNGYVINKKFTAIEICQMVIFVKFKIFLSDWTVKNVILRLRLHHNMLRKLL